MGLFLCTSGVSRLWEPKVSFSTVQTLTQRVRGQQEAFPHLHPWGEAHHCCRHQPGPAGEEDTETNKLDIHLLIKLFFFHKIIPVRQITVKQNIEDCGNTIKLQLQSTFHADFKRETSAEEEDGDESGSLLNVVTTSFCVITLLYFDKIVPQTFHYDLRKLCQHLEKGSVSFKDWLRASALSVFHFAEHQHASLYILCSSQPYKQGCFKTMCDSSSISFHLHAGYWAEGETAAHARLLGVSPTHHLQRWEDGCRRH